MHRNDDLEEERVNAEGIARHPGADGALYFSSAGNGGSLTLGTSGTWEGDFQANGMAIAAPREGE